MDVYEVWADRLTSSLRALGIAVMVVVLGWILVALADQAIEAIGKSIGKGIAAALLTGYVAGQLHALWRMHRHRLLKTIRSDEPLPVIRRSHVPLAATPKSEAGAALESENLSVKASVERAMAASKDEELRRAADLTAKQLQQAIEIVQGKDGKERVESDGALVGAVLEVLATNYRLATR